MSYNYQNLLKLQFMTLQEALIVLVRHQQWQKDNTLYFSPQELTEAINIILAYHHVGANEMIETNKIMTAVEWLFQKLWDTQKDKFTWHSIFEQAKEMEKQQIINAFGVGCHHESKRLVGYQDVAEQYYNETYGSKLTS